MAKEQNQNLNEDTMDDVIVTLNFDEGDQECRILTIFDMGEQDYIVLLPLDEKGNDNPEGIFYLYRYYEDEEGNPSLDNIPDDEEYEAALDLLDELQDEALFDEMD